MTTLALGEEFSIIPVIAALTYLKNYQTLFLPDNIGPPLANLGIYWSLAVEEHFYLLLPPIFLALARKPSHLAALLLVLILAVLAWRLVLVIKYEAPSPRTYMASETRFDSPLTGALLATLCLLRSQTSRVTTGLTAMVIISGLTLIVSSFIFRDPVFRETLRYTLQNAGIALIIFGILFGQRMGFVRHCLSRGPLRAVGIISYSLYLWHVFILYLAHRFLESSLVASVVAACVSFAIAYVSWFWLENRTAKLRERFGSRTVLNDQTARDSSELPRPLLSVSLAGSSRNPELARK
jgi:peptidoglycan/LPS O-acetylase OafA/YrhL